MKLYRCVSLLLKRTPDTSATLVQDVSVDLSSPHIRVPQKLLDRSQVVAIFQQVRSERVAQRVAARPLHDSCLADRPPDLPLHAVSGGVVSAHLT